MIHSWECKDRAGGNQGESRKGGEKEWEKIKESNLCAKHFTNKPAFMDQLELFSLYLLSGGVSGMGYLKVWTKDYL